MSPDADLVRIINRAESEVSWAYELGRRLTSLDTPPAERAQIREQLGETLTTARQFYEAALRLNERRKR